MEAPMGAISEAFLAMPVTASFHASWA